jgi:hypothetical protein
MFLGGMWFPADERTSVVTRPGLGGWCRTGVYGAGVINSGGREWFNGWLQFLNPVGVKWVWGLS